ncbi:hypothetical protein [Vagococcus lutrae]|uniref:hypothetical protein n=1 Tax=Vagococcus lutrae TaxID=81947 RepID=UPI002890BB99|nr:hypothetical protein [Vagococcus lutrae]MDT2841886.1 hypothetical protein [Vagococcus lutrae]
MGMGEVFKLFGTIGIDNSEANKALDEVENKGKGTANKLTGFFSKVSGKIGQSFSNIGKKIDFKGIHNQFNTLGGKINNTLVKGIQTGAKMMAIGGTAAMATAGATLVKGMNLAGELEQNMGGSEAVFTKYAKQMQQTGIEAYSKMGLSQSDFLASANIMGSLYQGVGFSVKDSMTMTSESMQRAADVASIMGIDIESAMEAVNGMAKGNFTMMDNLGVAINDTAIGNYALAKGIDKSTAKMTTQEKVGLATQMFLEKTAQYAGNYAKENDTLSGSLQTAKAALSNFMSGASTIDDALAAGLNFAKVAGRTASELAPKLFIGILQAVQTLIPKIPSIISGLASGMANVLGEVFGKDVQVKFESLVGVIAGAFDKLKQGFDFIVKYKDIFTPIAVGIGAIVGFLSAWNTVTTIATAIQGAFNAVLSANPIAILILAIVGLVAGLTYFFTKTETGIAIWQSFTDFLINAWTMIKEKASEIWNAITEVFSTVWESVKQVFSTALEFISNLVTVGFMLIQSIIQGVMLVIQTVIQVYWNIIKTVIQTVMNVISSIISAVWSVIGGTITNALNVIKNVITAGWNIVKSVTTTVFNVIKLFITTVWNGIKAVIQTVVNVIKNVVTNVWNGIKSVTTSVFNAIKSVASSVWNSIKSTIQSVVNAIKSVVSSVWNSIKSTTSNVFNSIKSTATSVWNGVKNAMITPIEAAKNKISGIVNAIKGFFSGMRLSIPKISLPPLPHFSLTGSFSLKPPSVPKLGVQWYADGGIMQKAMAFGMNGNDIMVGGEAGPEAILPLNRETLGGIGQGIASTMGYSQEAVVRKLDELIDRLEALFEQFKNMKVVMDSGELVGAIKNEINHVLGRERDYDGRGR